MKKITLLFLGINLLFSCNEKIRKNEESKLGYSIQGEINSKDSTYLYLIDIENREHVLLDSTPVEIGNFSFDGKIDYPRKALIISKQQQEGFVFILSNEITEIAIDINQFSQSAILGSRINDELNTIHSKTGAIYRKIDYLFPQLQRARIDNDYKKLNEINLKIKSIEAENDQYLVKFINDNPNNHLSVILLNDLWDAHSMDSLILQNIAAKLHPDIKKRLHFSIP